MPKLPDDKRDALRAQRALHPHPERVSDALFQSNNPFFDPRDSVQVKYEMLRRVRQDHRPVAETARAFGFSRPIFYQARGAFEAGGLPALQRQQPGPRRRHKLKPEVLEFLRQTQADHPGMGARQLAQEVRKRFDLGVHPRSIERALHERAKGGPPRTGPMLRP
jgi:transposase